MGQVIWMMKRRGKSRRPHMAFARRLGVCMEEAGYRTTRAFAEALGEQENTVSRWLRGETIPMSFKIPTLLRVIGPEKAAWLLATIRPKEPQMPLEAENNETA